MDKNYRQGELPRHTRTFQKGEKFGDAIRLILIHLKSKAPVLLLLTTWITVTALVLLLSGTIGTQDHKLLACTSVHWTNANQCGLDGNNCRPFAHRAPVTIGAHKFSGRPLVIGGSDGNSIGIYHGASFICGAAIHAGVIQNSRGGCGILHREGASGDFPSQHKNGITSIPFDSDFPLSYSLRTSDCHYRDHRWVQSILSMLCTLAVHPIEQSRQVRFGVVVLIIFHHVIFISDPPDEPSISSFKDLFVLAIERLFPALCIQQCVYKIIHPAMPQTLPLWTIFVAAIWTGALCNILERYYQGKILLLVLPAIACLVWIRARELRKEHRLYHHLVCYTLLAVVFWLSWIPLSYANLYWHLHHYFWPLILLPATGTSGRRHNLISLGLLVGISLNGAGRWGFSSLAGATESVSGAWPLSSPPIPIVNETHLHLQWDDVPDAYDGVNVALNGVIVASGFKIEGAISIDLRRENQKYYVGSQWVTSGEFRGLEMGEFLPFAILHSNGSFVPLAN